MDRGRMLAMRAAGYTFREIGARFGISRQRVQQIVGGGSLRGSVARRKVMAALAENPGLAGWDLAAEAGVTIQQVGRWSLDN